MADENCSEVVRLLSEYLNLELPADACRQIEGHLAGCRPCEEFAESLRSTVELCRQYRPAEMPGALSEGARRKLEEAYRRMMQGRNGS
jgi:RNA polymerase sigma-70 factor (ECF subfamily)